MSRTLSFPRPRRHIILHVPRRRSLAHLNIAILVDGALGWGIGCAALNLLFPCPPLFFGEMLPRSGCVDATKSASSPHETKDMRRRLTSSLTSGVVSFIPSFLAIAVTFFIPQIVLLEKEVCSLRVRSYLPWLLRSGGAICIVGQWKRLLFVTVVCRCRWDGPWGRRGLLTHMRYSLACHCLVHRPVLRGYWGSQSLLFAHSVGHQ